MLTVEDLRSIHDLTVDDTGDDDTLVFHVRVDVVESDPADPTHDMLVSAILDVRCPVNRGQPLLNNPQTRIDRQGGGLVPADWSLDNLSRRLEAFRDTEFRRRKVEQLRQEQLSRQTLVEDARERSRAMLQTSVEQFLLTLDVDTPPLDGLPFFLQRCGQAFILALQSRKN